MFFGKYHAITAIAITSVVVSCTAVVITVIKTSHPEVQTIQTVEPIDNNVKMVVRKYHDWSYGEGGIRIHINFLYAQDGSILPVSSVRYNGIKEGDLVRSEDWQNPDGITLKELVDQEIGKR